MQTMFSRLFGRKPTPSILTTGTQNTHWNDSTQSYEHRNKITMPATLEEVTRNPALVALTIYHSMPPTADTQRTAGWLASDDPARSEILREYLRLFNWEGDSIVSALRALCSRIQLKGESQQLDRLMQAFATRWIQCNPHHHFFNHGVVYTIAYSLLLLNTDLHTAVEDTKVKMTQKQYVKYVLVSIHKMFKSDNVHFAKASEYKATLESEHPKITSLVNDTHRYNEDDWYTCVGGILKHYYKSIARIQLVLPEGGAAPANRNSSDARSVRSAKGGMGKRSSMASFGSEGANASTLAGPELAAQAECEDSLEESTLRDHYGLDKLRLMGPPWSKEGPIKFRQFNTVASGMRKQHKQVWLDLFAVADRGQLRLYRLKTPAPNSKTRQGGQTIGDGNWMSNAQLVYNFILTNSLAQCSDQSDNNGEWSLMLSDERLLCFKTGTPETAAEYVYTCNYWAARLSKPPLMDMISSTEYGWSRPVELVRESQGTQKEPVISQGPSSDTLVINNEKIVIYLWKNQVENELHSGLGLREQLVFLKEYVNNVDLELAAHSAVFGDIQRIFTPKYAVSARAHANWKARSKFLLKESVQYTTYWRTLERVLRNHGEKEDEMAGTEIKQAEQVMNEKYESAPLSSPRTAPDSRPVSAATRRESDGRSSINEFAAQVAGLTTSPAIDVTRFPAETIAETIGV